MNQGIYEELITKLVLKRINQLDKDTYHISKTTIDKEEASGILAKHLSRTIKYALDYIKGEKQIEEQIEIANKIIEFLKNELKQVKLKEILQDHLSDDLVDVEGKILKAVFSKVDAYFSDFDLHLKEITPYTRLIHSELFTGGNVGVSLESELKKEILSADKIDLLVSFIKFKGFIILERELKEFTQRGGHLRVITTTYMGASDYKAIQMLSKLDNTQIKISYNTGNERLHAKAYLFFRNTGFHTGYIGSSNFSRSALTDGLEWNIKITTKEVSHIIDKFQKTFNSYWESDDFEYFDDSIHCDKLKGALKQSKNIGLSNLNTSFFDIKPYPFQYDILEKIEVERSVHKRNRNLVVAATGTGKTIISAFDYQRFRGKYKSCKLLFIAHRKEILEQALYTFRGVLKDNNFGELWVDGLEPVSYEYVFASVQTINNKLSSLNLLPNYFDYIVIDECHHLTANSYRGIIEYFTPNVLLGLTATPERMDGGDIQEDFNNRIAAEIRLPEALDRKLLCPFQYFGVTDSVDLSTVGWNHGKYVPSELTNIYTTNDRRVAEVIMALNRYTKDIEDVRALGFCVSIDHARFMAEKFTLAGLKADYLTSSNNNRNEIKAKLLNKDINYLFVVDIFNEGVDIPNVDTVLFLRPTESVTVFLQQLGRGLRLADGKDCLTVLDFVGNSRPEYNFEGKFRALIGKSSTAVYKEVEDDFPHLPLGCSVILERKAKDIILENIRRATKLNKNQIINNIKNFKHQTNLPLTLKNFLYIYNIPIQYIYKNKNFGWKRLCAMAGVINNFECANERNIVSAISNKWLSTASLSYFNFILNLAKSNFDIDFIELNSEERIMLLMLYYDVWQEGGVFNNIEDSIKTIGKNSVLVDEIVEVLEILINDISFKEFDIDLPYVQPLKVHSRYTRDQILAAFKLSSIAKKSSNREGTAENKVLNTELLFINLIKSEENFSPTTMYEDYAINDRLFHWQSQNATSPNTPIGQSYINHVSNNKKILLFVREKAKDEFGNTMGYVFIGEGIIKEYYGAKPMSVIWELCNRLPHFLWKDAAKLNCG